MENFSSYLNGALVNLSGALQGSNEYISENLGVHPSVVYGSLAACVALPLTMSRYGFSLGREQSSPFSSQPGGVPNVTEDDYDYITSQDLDAVDAGHSGRRQQQQPPVSSSDDDVLLIKSKGVTYPAHFPAYSISDGRLLVKDVRNRIGLMMEMSERKTRRVRLLYKGKQLKEPSAPVRDYRVRNKSELMAVVPDGGDGSETEEEMVVVNEAGPSDGKSRKRRKKRSSKRKGERGDDSGSSPRDGNTSNVDGQKSPSPAVAAPAGGDPRIKKLDDLKELFQKDWLPLCEEYIAAPPADPKKREDEHRKLGESVFQHVMLKVDGVDTEGDADIRARRKALVHYIQEVLKKLDAAKSA